MRRAIMGILAVATIVMASVPAQAGGWATVRLDEPPGDVGVNAPWHFGFMVLQHDVTPKSDVTPIVRAVHKETGEQLTITGRQEGPVGHFVAEVTLPRAGEWTWSIEPQPYGETSFETLIVRQFPGSSDLRADVLTGSCAAPGEIAFILGDIVAQPRKANSMLTPLALGAATVDVPLPDLVAATHAVHIGSGDAAAGAIACAEIEDISGVASAGMPELVLGLRGSKDAQNVGVAILRDEGKRTAISLYVLNPDPGAAAIAAAPTSSGKSHHIEILDAVFTPFSLEAKVGDTVTWTNGSQIVHTVTGEDLTLDYSGLIEPGGSFSITFEEPGTYRYRCGPHPGMVGEVVVA